MKVKKIINIKRTNMKIKILLLITILFVNLYSYDNITQDELNKSKRTILLFTDDNCRWCDWIKTQVVNKKDFKQLIKETKLDLKEIEITKSEFPKNIKIEGIPYFIIYKNGKKEIEFKGYKGKEEILSIIKNTFQ